jgi:hypothetical protein
MHYKKVVPPPGIREDRHCFPRNSRRAVLAVKSPLRRKKRALDRCGPLCTFPR